MVPVRQLIELISNQGRHFLGQVVESLTTFYAVVHKTKYPVLPTGKQTNQIHKQDTAEYTPENHERKPNGLGHKATKCAMGIPDNLQDKYTHNPFRLAFRLEVVMPIEFQIPSLRIQVKERLSEKESEKIRLATLYELEENQIATLLQQELEQRRPKAFVDKL